jgi:release factor glutamine methyltransferase
MTLLTALAEATTDIARRDAETLLAHILQRDRAWIFAHPEAEITPPDLERFRSLVARRAACEPLQYITGQQEFYGLTLRITPDTLIPRPETELLIEAVLQHATLLSAASPLRILDVGTGSGAIALALAANIPSARMTAVDISPAALAVARENAHRLNLADRIDFVHSDLLAAAELQTHPFDIIVSNPPYVATTDAPGMQRDVVNYEPHTALFAGADGLSIYRRLVPQAHAALIPNGLLAMEFGFGQREALNALLESPGNWHTIHFVDDYASIPRVALANRV